MKITLKIPQEIEGEKNNLITMFAAFLYEKGKLSLGQSAEMAGFSKAAFMEILSNYGVSIFNYPASDLEKELKNV